MIPPEPDHESGDVIVPLVAEDLAISRQRVPVAHVRVTTTTYEQERLVDELLTHERVEIERVPIGRPIDAAPPIREAGDTIIVSVVEEVITIERRLVLKEEIHVRRVRTTERYRETVILRAQDAIIDRIEADINASGANAAPVQGRSKAEPRTIKESST